MVILPSEITALLKIMARFLLSLVIPQFPAMHFNFENCGNASPTSNHMLGIPCFSRLGVLMLRINTANHQEMTVANSRGKKSTESE